MDIENDRFDNNNNLIIMITVITILLIMILIITILIRNRMVGGSKNKDFVKVLRKMAMV